MAALQSCFYNSTTEQNWTVINRRTRARDSSYDSLQKKKKDTTRLLGLPATVLGTSVLLTIATVSAALCTAAESTVGTSPVACVMVMVVVMVMAM
jgi:hypothetical protein